MIVSDNEIIVNIWNKKMLQNFILYIFCTPCDILKMLTTTECLLSVSIPSINITQFQKNILLILEDEPFIKLAVVLCKSYNMDEVILLSCQQLANDKEMSKFFFTKADGREILARILSGVRNHFPVENQIELTPETQPFVEMAYQFGEKGVLLLSKIGWKMILFSLLKTLHR